MPSRCGQADERRDLRRAKINNVTVECVVGDIAQQPDMDAVVNAANAQLRTGGGVAGALHRAAGPGLARECAPLAPIAPGEAVMTGAHALPNRFVIHCLGPVYGHDHPAEQLLADCYRKALALADEAGLESIGFPAISAGAFGYPMEAAARIAMRTVKNEIPGLKSVGRVRFILHARRDCELHAAILEEMPG